jgi:hypothetical protein
MLLQPLHLCCLESLWQQLQPHLSHPPLLLPP